MVSFTLDFSKAIYQQEKQIHKNSEILYIFTSTTFNERHKVKICMKCGTYHAVSGFWEVLIILALVT